MNFRFTYLLFLGYCSLSIGQDALHNYGQIQMHENAQLGLHLDLINDGTFDQNLGLVGFYGQNRSLRVSGSNSAVFNDIEIVIDGSLIMDSPLEVENNLNFIDGNISTQKDLFVNSITFRSPSFYTGAGSSSMVDGFSALINKENFTFPVGDGDRYSPLTISSVAINSLASCAYYFEDPNNPTSLSGQYNTQSTASASLTVSTNEFWKLEGRIPSYITLGWDNSSEVYSLADTIDDLSVVGWNKEESSWTVLGNTEVNGSLENGFITSDLFIPDDYEIITIGGNGNEGGDLGDLTLGNYYVNPNGDGQNDFLVIEGLENYPDNSIEIYNRFGVMVYKLNNYIDQFNGHANVSLTIKRNSGLESGVYFYILTINDPRKKHQGYLYLANPN